MAEENRRLDGVVAGKPPPSVICFFWAGYRLAAAGEIDARIAFGIVAEHDFAGAHGFGRRAVNDELTQVVEVSALKKTGLDNLVDAILVHDETRPDPGIAFALSRLAPSPTEPMPMFVTMSDVNITTIKAARTLASMSA